MQACIHCTGVFASTRLDMNQGLLHWQMKEQVGAYVGDLLKPRFKSNAITKEDYKWIVRKTVDKV